LTVISRDRWQRSTGLDSTPIDCLAESEAALKLINFFKTQSEENECNFVLLVNSYDLAFKLRSLLESRKEWQEVKDVFAGYIGWLSPPVAR